MSDPTQVKQTSKGMQRLLLIASFLVLSIGSSLYLLPAQTDIYFSWTINPPITAGLLGAGYLASFFLEFLSSRESIWVRTRIAVPGVWIFTTLTLIITLIHLDKFHFGSDRLITLAGTWVWLLVYISVPIIMAFLMIQQMRSSATNPPPDSLLPTWFRVLLALQGGTMFIVGFALFILPETALPLWPWKLSLLTSQAIGAWGIGVGFMALHMVYENDWLRSRPFLISYFLYAVLQLINLARFQAGINWSQSSAMLYVGFVSTATVTGAIGLWFSQKHQA